jgi:hypothetical protein
MPRPVATVAAGGKSSVAVEHSPQTSQYRTFTFGAAAMGGGVSDDPVGQA